MTRQLTLPKENQNDVTVWSCLFLNDNTVVVGDSLGRVIFYDGKLGALLNTFKVLILLLRPIRDIHATHTWIYYLFISFMMLMFLLWPFHPMKNKFLLPVWILWSFH